MTDSRSPHGALTEPVRKTMSGKGREGKGIRKGREGEVREGFHHIVTLGTREVVQPQAGRLRDVMVSATRICDSCWMRIESQHIGRRGCGEVTYWHQLWRIVEVPR